MLMDDFYTVHELQPSEFSLSCILVFNAHHPVFQGHFPGQPVVPGVCMVQIIKELLEQQLDEKLFLVNAPQIKFLRLITPDISPLVSMEWEKPDSVYRLKAGFKKDADLFKFSGDFQEENK